MEFSKDNHRHWHFLPRTEHDAKVAKLEADGFIPQSLSLSGTVANPLYTAVYVRPPRKVKWQHFSRLSEQELQTFANILGQEGLGLRIVASVGTKAAPIYAAAFGPASSKHDIEFGMTLEAFENQNDLKCLEGRILISADIHGTADDPVYTGVWVPNPAGVAWNAEAIDLSIEDHQAHYLAMRDNRAHPALVALAPSGRLMRIWQDSVVGKWDARNNLTPAQFDTLAKTLAKDDLFPYRLSANRSGSTARLSAIFTKRSSFFGRRFTINENFRIAVIDDAVKLFMERQNLRGMSLAIGHGSRLLYAQGYNFSEASAHYPRMKASTPYRLASVSKTFCAMAVWKLLERPDFNLDTKVNNILDATKPDGSQPVDDFNAITVQQMLESRSGINQNLKNDFVKASQAANGTLPVKSHEMANWIAAQPLANPLGEVTVYGSTDYLLLGQVVRRKLAQASFEAALELLVGKPLGLKATRSARSLLADQLPGEAPYHLAVQVLNKGVRHLMTDRSVMSADRPLVPYQYGSKHYEVYDGTSGLSASVLDMARLGTAMSTDADTPLFSKAQRDLILKKAMDAQTAASGPGALHGFHGFDSVKKKAGVTVAKKGGGVKGAHCFLQFEVGGFVIAFAHNGDLVDTSDDFIPNYLAPVIGTLNWADTDLFPQFGYASLIDKKIKFNPKWVGFDAERFVFEDD